MMLGYHLPLCGIDIKINQMNSRWALAWLFAFTEYQKTYLYIELSETCSKVKIAEGEDMFVRGIYKTS